MIGYIKRKRSYERFMGDLPSSEARTGLVVKVNVLQPAEVEAQWTALREQATVVSEFRDFEGGECPLAIDPPGKAYFNLIEYVELPTGDVNEVLCQMCEHYEQTLCQRYSSWPLVHLRIETEGSEVHLVPTRTEYKQGRKAPTSINMTLGTLIPLRGTFMRGDAVGATRAVLFSIILYRRHRGFEWGILGSYTGLITNSWAFNETTFWFPDSICDLDGAFMSQLADLWRSALQAVLKPKSETRGGSLGAAEEAEEEVARAYRTDGQPQEPAFQTTARDSAEEAQAEIARMYAPPSGTPTVASARTHKFCPECGRKTSADTKFCGRCGQPFDRAPLSGA